ncbi:MAG: V4R domain-containing protein [Myxococcota bacterium]
MKLPQLTLGKDTSDNLASVDANGWYPISVLLEAMERIDTKLGVEGLRQMGRLLFKLSHEQRVAPKSAREVIEGLDAMYHHANRGDGIGGWRVVLFEPGLAHLEKTTPHHCAMEEGIVGAALQAAGAPCTIKQTRCMRTGSDHCLFVINSVITDHRWMGGP